MIITTEEVFSAYVDCRKGKRNKPASILFEADLANNIRSLRSDLNNDRYEIGVSRCFGVLKPKPREVWAGSFRDRVVHHIMVNRVSDRFIRSFSASSCACISGRGTLYGSRRLEGMIRSGTESWSKPLYFLKMDISNFFVSIQKDILFGLLSKKIDSAWDLDLARKILYHDPTSNYVISGDASILRKIPAHKSLFNTPSFMGLAIGNLSSQFYANVYMDVLDQYVEHKIRPLGYVRYVDDFVLVDSDVGRLKAAKDDIEGILWDKLLLVANPTKTEMNSVYNGVDFVGRVIKPWRTTPRATLARNAHSKIRNGTTSAEGITSYLGLLRQSKSWNIRRDICRRALKMGHSVDHRLTKVFPLRS